MREVTRSTISANDQVSGLARLTALSCFFFAALAIPWLAVGTYGAVGLLQALFRGGEWSALGIFFGAPIIIIALVPMVLGYRRFHIGRELWRPSLRVAKLALRLGNTTVTLNAIALASCLLAEGQVYMEKGRFARGGVAAIIIVIAALALIAIIHGFLLRRVSAVLLMQGDTETQTS